MTNQEKIEVVQKSISDNLLVRIYFKQISGKTLKFGKFIKSFDHDELIKKGFVRFVDGGSIDLYEVEKANYFTRILRIEDFEQFRFFQNESR